MRPGVTLIELLVVLVILGTIGGIVTVSLQLPEPPPEELTLAKARTSLAEARRRAITRGTQVTIAVTLRIDSGVASDRLYVVTALPDGSVLADSALGLERFTGRPRLAVSER